MNIDRFLVALSTQEWENCKLFKDDVSPDIYNYVKFVYDSTGQVPSMSAVKSRFSNLPAPSNVPFSFYKEEREKELFVERATPILEVFNRESQSDFSNALLHLRNSLQELERPRDVQGHSLKSTVSDRIEFFEHSAPRRIKTGIDPLDAACGGLEQDEYFVISARLGIGKSWLGQFIAANIAKQGKKVLFYSGEMTAEQVGSRIDTIWAEGEISNFLYTRNRLSDEEKAKVQQKVSQIEGDVIIFTPKDLPTSACRPSDLAKFIHVYNPDVVVLDQISLMEPDGGKKLNSDADRKAELSYQLTLLQAKNPIPFIVISQLNRGAQNEEATAANIAGSDRIGQDASLIVALKRKDDRLRLSILKARSFSPQDGPIEFAWDVDRGKLTPVLSGMDAVRARARQAQQQDEVDNRSIEDDLSSWED